ncbi:sensor histidine kinase [Ornithinicoccus halotolerans]|uniref:sensor histidine kinase n=1 Tax=Ornithinicoccus halotolerans TaxID=1748220 RepID=UPI0012962C40|nr:sensor histidine kinase [Ornithinicoccus halotolerans]
MTQPTVGGATAFTRSRSGAVAGVLMVVPPVVAVASFAVMTAAGGQLVASHVLVGAVVGSVSAVLGGYLASRVPDNPMGWLFALSGVAYVASIAVSAWVTAAQAWQWPGVLAAAWVSEWIYVFALGPQLTVLLLLFPDGSPLSHRWRVLVWTSGAVIAALVVAWMLTPQIHLSQDELVPNPFLASEVAAQLTEPLLTVLGLCGLASFASLVLRLRRAAPGERRRIAPYVVAATLVIVALGATPPLSTAGPYVQTVVLPLLPIAATLCVLRYRLYDLEIAVRRSLVWIGLTVVVVGGYALVVEAVSNLLQRRAGLPESLLAAGAVAAVFQPTRVWLQRAVGRALYGHRDDPDRALTDLGRTLELTAEPTTALDRAAERIAASLAVPWVAIEVARGGGDEESAYATAAGHRPAWATEDCLTTVPLVHAGTHRGTLTVCRRSPGEPLSSRDRDLLERLAYPIAAGAAAFRLTDDLRRSRERLVVAREEERRRLRHDLHDELGPLLAAIAVRLDAATLRARRTGGAEESVLVDLRHTAQDAITTVRRTVEDLRPPALDELGLVDALRATVAGFEAPGGPALTVVATQPLPPLPAAVEVAAYRIAVEAVTNAVRHAAARKIVVSVAVEGEAPGEALAVTVHDDGHGLATGRAEGVGTTSMRERAEELGGHCTLTGSADAGTRVHADLPIGGG